MDLATAILTGLGLAAAAGLNAYIPLLVVAVLQALNWVSFGAPYDNLANPPVIAVLAILLVVEVFADKVPIVDSVNDVIQTVVRPAAGAVLMAASTGVAGELDPTVALVAGLLTAGTVHGVKAAARPMLNAGTAGAAAPVVSTGEDVLSTVLTFVALLFPVLVLAFLGFLIWLIVRIVRRRRTSGVAAGSSA